MVYLSQSYENLYINQEMGKNLQEERWGMDESIGNFLE